MFVIKETQALYSIEIRTLSARVAKAVTPYVVGRRIRHGGNKGNNERRK